MLVVGLTGGIGSGKTTVAQLFARSGAVVVDVDALGRDVIGPGGSAVGAVVARFGRELLGPDGAIDRAALAAKAFASEQAIADLNAISHPAINAAIDRRLSDVADDSICILDMAILVESNLGVGIEFPYEIVITVETPDHIRFDRLEGRGMSRDEARRRMESQATDEQRRAVSQFVVANGGDLDELGDTIRELWGELQRLHDQKRFGGA